MSYLTSIVGSNIKKHRHRLGYSQQTLALESGIDYAHVGRIERGEHNPTLFTLRRISYSLSIEPYELFLEEEASDPYATAARYLSRNLLYEDIIPSDTDPHLLLRLLDSDMLKKVTVFDIERGATRLSIYWDA